MTDHLTTTAIARVQKARSELIMSRRFYGVLVSNVEPVITRRHKTAATDGKRHFWNPDFIATLSQQQLLFVQAHESEHDARKHSSRRGARDPEKWNEAADYAINIDLVDEGFVPPPGVLIDAKYRGWGAEDIYRARELDEARQQKQQEQQQPQAGDDSDDEDDESNGGAGDEESDENSDNSGDQDDAGDEAGDDQGEGGGEAGDQDGDEADQGDGSGDEPGDEDGDQGQGAGDEAGDEAGEGQGGGQGDGEGDEPAEGQGGGQGAGEGEPGEGEPSGADSVVGDVGGCGEVLDAAETAAEIADEERKWERVTRQAASMAKAIGELPGHVTREIERSNNPTQDWRDTLRAFFDQGGLKTETWNRPNRRFAHRGLILPGSQRDGVNKAVFLIDTSGSCDDVALALVRDEAQAALDDGVVDELVVVYGDTRVTRVDEYRTGDEIEFDPRGGGGTDMKPLFAFAREQHDDASLIVCFTDLYIGDAGDEPLCPTLFAVHGYPDAVRELIKQAPWGSPAIDVGAH